jgi:hypothetical protein
MTSKTILGCLFFLSSQLYAKEKLFIDMHIKAPGLEARPKIVSHTGETAQISQRDAEGRGFDLEIRPKSSKEADIREFEISLRTSEKPAQKFAIRTREHFPAKIEVSDPKQATKLELEVIYAVVPEGPFN